MAVKMRKRRTAPEYLPRDLFNACESGDMDQLRRLISVAEFDASKVIYDTDQSLLAVAIDHHDASIVSLLLQTVLSTEGIESELLKRAIQTNCYGVVKAVLSHIDDRSTLGQCRPAYHCIAIDIAIVDLLIAEVPCFDFAPLISHAIAARRNDVLAHLIRKGAIQTMEDLIYPNILADAVNAGCPSLVETLLESGVPFDANCGNLLNAAARRSCVPILQRIVAEGIHSVDSVVWSLRECLEHSGEPEAVLLLTTKAATMEEPTQSIDFALNMALKHGREPAALTLMDVLGAQPTLATHGVDAARSGCSRVLAMMLADDTECVGEARIERLGRLGQMLKSSSDPEVLRLLLHAGADVHSASALYECCRQLRLDSLQLLLDAGAKIMPQNPKSLLWTLRLAHEHPERHGDLLAMVRLLLDRGAPTRMPNGRRSVLHREVPWATALAPPIKEAVELVLQRDPGLLEWRDNRGHTRLLEAMGAGDSEMVRLLVAAGADVHARDYRGRPALVLLPLVAGPSCGTTPQRRYVRLVARELLAAGSEVTWMDANQRTVLHLMHSGTNGLCWCRTDTGASVLATVFAEHILSRPRGEEATLVRPRETGDAEEAPNKKQRVSA